MAPTDFVRAENKDFVAQIRRARVAANELLSDETAGPWSPGEFLHELRNRADVRHNPAMYVEDELINDRVVRVSGGLIVRALASHPATPDE
jgi:hypothetical protein